MEETYSFMESKRFDTLYGKANEDLLMYNGHINEPSLALTLGGMAAIIGAIIFFSSVSLIYKTHSASPRLPPSPPSRAYSPQNSMCPALIPLQLRVADL